MSMMRSAMISLHRILTGVKRGERRQGREHKDLHCLRDYMTQRDRFRQLPCTCLWGFLFPLKALDLS